MILSILIPTLPDRKTFLAEMLQNIAAQACKLQMADHIEILVDNRDRNFTTGFKRNELLKSAQGKYTWFVDDDDHLYEYAIEEILKAAEKDPDVIGINGIMTTDGINQLDWEIRLGHPYKAIIKDGKEYYLRFPNHITPMKREHALKVKFPDKTIFEDYEWAQALNDLNVLKTQVVIEKPIYHYRCRSNK